MPITLPISRRGMRGLGGAFPCSWIDQLNVEVKGKSLVATFSGADEGEAESPFPECEDFCDIYNCTFNLGEAHVSGTSHCSGFVSVCGNSEGWAVWSRAISVTACEEEVEWVPPFISGFWGTSAPTRLLIYLLHDWSNEAGEEDDHTWRIRVEAFHGCLFGSCVSTLQEGLVVDFNKFIAGDVIEVPIDATNLEREGRCDLSGLTLTLQLIEGLEDANTSPDCDVDISGEDTPFGFECDCGVLEPGDLKGMSISLSLMPEIVCTAARQYSFNKLNGTWGGLAEFTGGSFQGQILLGEFETTPIEGFDLEIFGNTQAGVIVHEFRNPSDLDEVWRRAFAWRLRAELFCSPADIETCPVDFRPLGVFSSGVLIDIQVYDYQNEEWMEGTLGVPCEDELEGHCTINLDPTELSCARSGCETGTQNVESDFPFFPLTCVGGTTTEVLEPGGSPWVCPEGVTSIDIEAIGGGGGGWRAQLADVISGKGGGGGAYASINNMSVTPSASYAYHVGQGGDGAIASTGAQAGGDSWFDSTSVLLARGGGAATSTTAGTGGSGGTSIGDTTNSGGNGGNGTTGINGGGGGGGGGGGPNLAGGVGGVGVAVGSGGAGGAGGAGDDPGGDGGDGGNQQTTPGIPNHGGNGNTFGGGGGGAGSIGQSGLTANGGDGATGAIRLSYLNESNTVAELIRT